MSDQGRHGARNVLAKGLHRGCIDVLRRRGSQRRHHVDATTFASLVGTLLGAVPELMVAAATNEAARVVRRAHCRHRISCHRSTTFALGRRCRGGRSWFALLALELALRRVEASIHHLVPHEVAAFCKRPQFAFIGGVGF